MGIKDDTSYTGAWNEAIRRVIGRDSLVLGYFSVATGSMGLAYGSVPAMAVVVPWLTLVVGALVVHHDFIISSLNRYLLARFSGEEAQTWHASRIRHSTWVGFLFYTVPICGAAAALVYTSHEKLKAFNQLEGTVLEDWAGFAGVSGIVLLAVGRVAQLISAYASPDQEPHRGQPRREADAQKE